MPPIFATHACLPTGWQTHVRLEIENGKISEITTGGVPQPEDTKVDCLLPALGNLHSHSFQRAMAGMTERRAKGRDSFWTWRTLMYRFVKQITPEQYQAIAALVFMEMLEAGYAAVGEFHYVHHQADGTPYDNSAELSERVFAAAAQTGIGLTHLPVLYSYGGAGQIALAANQRRFGNSVDSFGNLVSRARDLAQVVLPDDTTVGIAPHSLRATNPADLGETLALAQGAPLHIHIAEQPQEVADIQGWLGARPVAWLLDNMPVNDTWCLIHATHMTDAETRALAQSGAVVGLCPITEANLGDGPFNGVEYLAAEGRFGIGSDSNIRIALGEELRLLEYSQRLRYQQRNLLSAQSASVGKTLYLAAAKGGAQAMGRNSGEISVGKWADLLAIDTDAPALLALRPDQLLDGLVFAAGETCVTDVWSAGRHMVKQGRHRHRDAILRSYGTAIRALLDAS